MSEFCRNCGHNLKNDEPITVGDWTLAPDFALYAGRNPRLAPQHVAIMHTLAKARGRTVAPDVIAARVSNADGGSNVVRVAVHRIRSRLREQRIPNPIGGTHGLGYCWQTGLH